MVETIIKPNFQTKITRSLQGLLWVIFGLIVMLFSLDLAIVWKILTLIVGAGIVLMGPISIINAWRAIIIFNDNSINFKVKGELRSFHSDAFISGELLGIKLVYNVRGKVTLGARDVNFDKDAKHLEKISIITKNGVIDHETGPYSVNQRGQINFLVQGFAKQYNVPLQGIKKS